MTSTGTIPATGATADAARRGSVGHGQRKASRERLRDGLVVGLPALLAAALCLYELPTRSLWLDEAATVAIASQHGAAFGHALAHDGGNMLGYYALLHVLISWFGSGPWVIRLPSVMAAAATVAMLGGLALRLFGRRTALGAGLLMALSLTLVYWGQDARGYALMIALITGSFLAFVALLEGQGGWRAWVAYVVLTTAAVYAGLEAVLVVPAQLVALLWHRDRLRPVLGAVAATAACCIPLAVLAADRGSGQLFWVPPPSFRVLRQIVEALTSSGLQPSYYTRSGPALVCLSLMVLAAAAGRIAWLARVGERVPAGRAGLILSWLLVPGVLALIESGLGQSIFQARYLLVLLPAVPLLIAWTLADRRLPRPLALAGFAALIVLEVLQLAPAYGVSSENWRGATAYVLDHSRPGDCVAFYPLDNRQAFRYYLTSPGTAPRPILPALPWRQVRPFVEDYSSLSPAALARLTATCGRVWLLASHEGQAGGPLLSRANHRRFAGLTMGLRRGYPVVQARSFGAEGIVTVMLYSR
jgi:mannosyltransferase